MSRMFRKIDNSGLEEKLQRMLSEPVGTPVKISPAEAIAIVEAGRGSRSGLPTGAEYVRRISKIWRSMMPRQWPHSPAGLPAPLRE